MTKSSSTDAYWKIGFFLLIGCFIFFKISDIPLSSQEAREGLNALMMKKTGDYTTVRYINGEVDNYFNYPPLQVWLKLYSFELVSFDHFGLRLPDILALLFGFYFLFHWISLYQKIDFAFFTCLMLMVSDGIILGFLESFDAFLFCCSMASLYYFSQLHDFLRQEVALKLGISLGLGLLANGFMVIWIILILGLYMLGLKVISNTTRNSSFWVTTSTFCIFITAWLFIGSTDFYIGQVILLDGITVSLWTYLNTQFWLWNYLFLLSIPIGIYLFLKEGHRWIPSKALLSQDNTTWNQAVSTKVGVDRIVEAFQHPNGQMVLMSICGMIVFLFAGFLLDNVVFYGLALPFIAVFTAAIIFYLNQKIRFFSLIFIGILGFSFIQQSAERWQYKPPYTVLQHHESLLKQEKIVWFGEQPSDEVWLQLNFIKPQITAMNDIDHLNLSQFVLMNNEVFKETEINWIDYSILGKDSTTILLTPF